jgi:hypothetical protein
MKLVISTALALGLLGVLPSAAMATSCYDLWYARNAIYDDNGYCFSTELAQDTFDNSDCWTKHPHFSKKEQKLINAIIYQEQQRYCHVN